MTTKGVSIAVMPFRNLSPEPDTEYFANGFVEDLTADLTRFPSLVVSKASYQFDDSLVKPLLRDNQDEERLIRILAFAALSAARRLADYAGRYLNAVRSGSEASGAIHAKG